MFQIPYNCPITTYHHHGHNHNHDHHHHGPLFKMLLSRFHSIVPRITFISRLLYHHQISTHIYKLSFHHYQISTKALVFVTIKFPPSFFLIVIKFPPKLLLSSTCKSSQCNSSMVSSILVVAVIASFSIWRAPMKSCVYSGTVLKIISPPPLEI